MNRKLKSSGLVFVAVALTVVMASAAQAQFTSSVHHTISSGSQKEVHKFTAGTGIGAIACTTATFSGTSSATSAAVGSITPTYSGCKDSLGRTIDVTKNTLVGTSTSGAGKGTMHLDGEIVLTVTGSTHCTIAMNGAQAVNGMNYKNLGGTSGVEVTTTTNNVHSSIAGGFFACGTSSTTSSTGTYTGTTIVTGKDTGGSPVAISVD
jgi:hypothetical protein